MKHYRLNSFNSKQKVPLYISRSTFFDPGRAISRVLYLTIIYLDLPLLTGSSDLPYGQATGSRLPRPVWSCSGWGLHGRHVSMPPVSSYLTISTLPQPYCFGGMFLLHFPYSYLRRTLSGTLALWSPDFPHKPKAYAIVCSTRECDNLS